MGSAFSTVIAVAAFIAAIGAAIYGLIVRTIVTPIQIALLAWNGSRDALFLLDRALFQRYLIVLGVAIVLLLIFTVGPFGVSNTGDIIEAINQVYSCFVRYLIELFNKLYEFHWKLFYEFIASTINKAFIFIFSRMVLSYDEIKTTIACLEIGGSFQHAFDIPAQLWLTLGALPFSVLSGPRQNKREPFFPGEAGYHYPLENSQPNAILRFEFNPDYQAQGPATVPSSGWPNAPYILRDFWSQLSRTWEDLGKLIFGLVSKIVRPTQRFFPAFYIDISNADSIWREGVDLVCRFLEFFEFSYIWPFGPGTNPQQEIRDGAVGYTCGLLRVLACFLQRTSLFLNDVLTTTRPILLPPGVCSVLPPTVDENIQLFLRGFPFVDFFVPPQGPNLNIFRSNIVFCEFMVYVHGQSCGGLATGSLSYNTGPPVDYCPEWPGNNVPLPQERINYIKLLVDCFIRLITVIVNQVQDSTIQTQLDGGGDIAARWLNFITSDLVFVFNAVSDPVNCQLTESLEFWLGVRLTDNAIATLEFAYADSCSLAIPDPISKKNIFLCLVALASRAQEQSFWRGLCQTIDGLGSFTANPQLDLNCAMRRKRELGDARPQNTIILSWYQTYRLYAPYYAYETRNALHAFDYCFTNPNTSMLVAPRCNTTCSTRPCVDSALDCVQQRLILANDADNYWFGAVERGSVARSGVRATALAADVWYGCEDGDVNMLFRTVNATVEVLRDISARMAASTLAFAIVHTECGEAAEWSNSTTYLHCIQLKPLGTTWEETLELNNITDGTLCGALLHERGIVLANNSLDKAYEGCLTMLAYGSRARASGASDSPLAEFLNGWTAAHAVSGATKIFQQPTTLREWNSDARNTSWWTALINGTAIPKQPPPPGAAAAALKDDLVAQNIHDAISFAYSYFHYLADVYEKVITSNSDGIEKDQIDNALFRDRVLVTATAIGTKSDTVVAARKVMQHEVALSSTAGIREVARVYGRSLLWVDRLYMSVNNAASNVDATRDGLARVQTDDDPQISSIVEFRVRQRYAGDVGGRSATILKPMLGMRVVSHLAATETLADYYQRRQLVDNETAALVVRLAPPEPFVDVELERLITALELYSQYSEVQGAQTKTALAALHELDMQLTRVSLVGDYLARRMDVGTVAFARVALRITWNLINNRLRLNSLPAAQAAHVLIDLITNGERTDDLAQWFVEKRGYIVGVGYVDRDVYDDYMEYEGRARRTLLAGYFSPLRDEEYQAVAANRWIRRRRVLYNHATGRRPDDNGVLRLPGTTMYARYLEKQRQRLRQRLDFRHRAKFLVQHGLHDDRHLHVVASKNWLHYGRAFAAALNGTAAERRELSVIAAVDVQTNEFFLQLWDLAIVQAGGGSDVVTMFFADLEDQIAAAFEAVFVDIVTKLEDLFNQFLAAATCQGTIDYAIGGTGTYRLGCLPFVPERLFSWFTFFPAALPVSPPYGGIFTWITGPGYAVWPAEMLAPGGDCVPERNPTQCPNPTYAIWDQPIQFFVDLCISNACDDPMLAPARPLCPPIKCDWCPRVWRSAADAGFTSGWHNIVIWSAAFREIVRLSITAAAAPGFWFVFALFVLIEFPTIMPVTPSVLAAFTIFIMLYGETYIRQTPERFVFQFFFLFAFRAFGRGLAWIIFLVYFVNLFPVLFQGASDTLFGNIIVTVVEWVSIDQIFRALLIGIRFVLAPLPTTVFDIDAALTPLITLLGSKLPAVPPTTAEFLYSLFSLYNFFVLAVFVLVTLLVILIVGVVAAFVLAFLADIFIILLSVLIAFSALLLRFNLMSVSSTASELEEEVENLEDGVNAQAEEMQIRNAEFARQIAERNAATLRQRRTAAAAVAKNQ